MTERLSAGILLYRVVDGRLEVLLAHPGGPFHAARDAGNWTIPKGEPSAGEDLAGAALREFEEETGSRPNRGTLLPLGSVRQKGGKVVHAWAVAGDLDAGRAVSNTFEMEWPPRSGQLRSFPEIDRVAWFAPDEARRRVKGAQAPFVDRLEALLADPAGLRVARGSPGLADLAGAERAVASGERAGPEWDAATYDRIADPQARWGAAVVERLDPSGVSAILDAGCGSGRVTELLLERVPGAHVVALDGSSRMIDEARRRLARYGDRVSFVVADLREPLPVGPVDAIVSTATFHWVPDHAGLFRRLAAVLRSGGRLVAQYGGAGNIATVIRAMNELGNPVPDRWTYPEPEAERELLVAAGFRDVETWLQPEPTRFDAGEPFETFLATVILREHVDGMAEAERREFIGAVAARLPGPVLDYVRLNVVARRS